LRMQARFLRERRGVFEMIFKEVNFIDKFYKEIFKEMHGKRWSFYSELVEDCQNDSYIDKNIETDKVVSILIGSVMEYAKHSEIDSNGNYYGKIDEIIDLLIKKLK